MPPAGGRSPFPDLTSLAPRGDDDFDSGDVTTIVAVLIGNLWSFFLAGIGCCQFFLLFGQLFPSRLDHEAWERKNRLKDTAKWKLITYTVLTLFFLASIDIVFKVLDLVEYQVRSVKEGKFGLIHIPRVGLAIPVLESCVAVAVQGVYMVRLYVVWPGKRGTMFKLAGLLFVTLSLVQSAFAVWTACRWMIPNLPITEWNQIIVQVSVWWGAASVNDILLCISFCYSLSKLRTGFKRTDARIMSWVYFTIETGLLSSLFQIASLILFIGYAQALDLIAVMPIMDVYINSVLLLFRTMIAGGPRMDAPTSTIMRFDLDTQTPATSNSHFAESRKKGSTPAAGSFASPEVVITTLPARHESSYELRRPSQPQLHHTSSEGLETIKTLSPTDRIL